MKKIQRALLSVTDKTGLPELAKALAAYGVELISTGGTAKLLREAGLQVLDVADLTGFPEMLDGRVKTLHPRIAGGILAVRSKKSHMASLKEHSIRPIDMLVVNLYAFELTAANPDASFDDKIENIDIGGPSLIRAGAKNFRDVAVVTSPDDYLTIVEELNANEGALSEKTLWSLAQRAFDTTAQYDRAIAGTLAGLSPDGSSTAAEIPPPTLDLFLPRKQVLRYGENPHQKAALYAAGGGVAGGTQLHGKELSYNNLVDLDAAWALINEFDDPACAIIKHTNPCGCAEQETLAAAYTKALECDPVSAFGSVIAVNKAVDGETAQLMSELFVEAIAAPAFEPDAVEILTAKKNIRLIAVAPTEPGVTLRSISGGILAQTEDRRETSPEKWDVVTERSPSKEEEKALRFAWKVVKHVKSNAILYSHAGQTLGVGAGQMSRVDSAKIGAMKARLPLGGCVVASDAFFPFADGLEEVAKAGAVAVIQPGGSKRDDEVIAAANAKGIAMVFTGVRHFRH
ncbi:MAG: bifunctional phosphoribosylaminoimidazolecarboxamide formyltransferase/IMP cyclohydrolase [Acidobacteria bacterium]|nr:bifunctional phosphoribosylaminoimidazolecarboxamide formyltransferase/IMP cyclohydrolase [Acidobacteriota bacterium]